MLTYLFLLQKIAKHENWSNFTAKVLNAHDLSSLTPDSYTHTVTSFLLPLIPTPHKAVQELYRVTKPGGILGVANWAQPRFIFYPNWEKACQSLDPEYKMPDMMDPYWCHAETIKEGLEKEGFKDVVVKVQEYPWEWDNTEEFVKYIFEGGNPVVTETLVQPWREKGEGKLEELRKRVVGQWERDMGKGKLVMQVKVAFALGRK